MENLKPINKDDVVGQMIECVYHMDLSYDVINKFQSRRIIIELVTGLTFSLQQETGIVNPITGWALIYPCEKPVGLNSIFKSTESKDLRSPIMAVMMPYEWKNHCGLVLENGFVLHDGFSSWDNGSSFYIPDADTMLSLIELKLPVRG